MFIVVESGSTKADWMIINEEKEVALTTIGFNPYFHSKQDILIELNNNLELDLIKQDVKEIFFYGAGCSILSLNKIIEDGLGEYFANAKINVNHDLNASAYACYQDKPVIACILGTGSNSCLYNGESIYEKVPALGHILGDEGSGCYFGKKLLTDFLYNKLPIEINREFVNAGLNKEIIVENVYRKPNANVYIASFMPILLRNKDIEYSQNLIFEGLNLFIENHVKCFDNYREKEVSFVGSVAYLLKDELEKICLLNDLKIGKIIRRPLEQLVSYHKHKLEKVQKKLSFQRSDQLN